MLVARLLVFRVGNTRIEFRDVAYHLTDHGIYLIHHSNKESKMLLCRVCCLQPIPLLPPPPTCPRCGRRGIKTLRFLGEPTIDVTISEYWVDYDIYPVFSRLLGSGAQRPRYNDGLPAATSPIRGDGGCVLCGMRPDHPQFPAHESERWGWRVCRKYRLSSPDHAKFLAYSIAQQLRQNP